MRKIGHNVMIDLLRTKYGYRQKNIREHAVEREKQLQLKRPIYFSMYVDDVCRGVKLAYIFDEPLEKIVNLVRDALPELIVCIDLGGQLEAPSVRQYIGMALTVEHQKLIRWLSDLPLDMYIDPDVVVSEVGIVLIRAMQAGAKGDRQALATIVQELEVALNPDQLIVNIRSETAMYVPIKELLSAIVQGDQVAFEESWQKQAAAWKKRFGRVSERANMDGLLDFETLGIGKIAQKFDLTVPDTNLYAPLALLEAGKML